MKRKTAAIWTMIAIAALFLHPPAAFSLEALSNEEMRSVTGQAGISAAVDEGVMVIQSPVYIFQDVGTKDRFGNSFAVDGHLSYKTKALLEIKESFGLDIGMAYGGQTITVTDQTGSGDVSRTFDHPLSDMAMIALAQQSNDPFYTLSVEDISVYNHSLGTDSLIGDLNIAGLDVLESRASFFPTAGAYDCGIRAVAGVRTQIPLLELENPDQAVKATFSDVIIGAAFTGDPLPETGSSTNEIDTSTWAFDAGMFELGIPHYYHDDPTQEDTQIHTYPFTLDVTGDSERTGDFKKFIVMNAPMKGSIRVKNISSDNFDMGPIAIDGIRLYKNTIEFPGRGIGN